ncbi:MAG TPA: hypothetical protein VG148_18105 [Pyrinomonadaceae bacterium]|nr:hypothetical protein [Pyrinomonadaceae bacterium]
MVAALIRCLLLRCPACGLASIVLRPFQVKDRCPACGVLFKREEGFFVGAIAINVVTTEAVILLIYVGGVLVAGFDFRAMLAALLAAAALFPVAFYHHSWSLWLTFDHLVEKLPQGPPPPPRGRPGA